MIYDICTVMRKEFKELLLTRGIMRGSSARILIFLGILGIFTPYTLKLHWLNSPIVLFYALWFPFMLVAALIADSFAGERERHSLETLLASRLSDTAILLGKVTTAVVYAWGLILGMLLLGLVSVNVFCGHGTLLLYKPAIGIGSVTLSLCMSILAALIGVLISLRSQTVKQAQQTLALIPTFVVVVVVIGVQLLPETIKEHAARMTMHMNLTSAVLSAAGILMFIALVLFGIAIAKFQRARLILD